MPDFERHVAERLGDLRLEAETKARVLSELAQMLEDSYLAALDGGASPEEALLQAEAEVPDWVQLGRRLVAISAGEDAHVRARRAGSGGVAQWGAEVAEDLFAGVRRLRHEPLFSALVVVMIALGVAATTVTWSVVEAVLLEPLPYPEPDRLVRVWETHPETRARTGVASGNVKTWRERSRAFAGIAGWYVMGRTLHTAELPEVVEVAQVSADFFPLIGVRPLVGRTFTAEETARATFDSAAGPTGTDLVVLLGHRIWQSHFGGDPDVVGRSLSLERQRWRIVGVLPPGFALPDADVDLWIPWSFQGERPRDQRYLDAVARVAPGVTVEQATGDLESVAAGLGRDFPATNAGWGVALEPLAEEIVGGSRRTLTALFAAVGCVLLIACTNIANLKLVRLGLRSREIAVRLALGASRARLMQHLLAENLVLALAGGLLALPLALVGLELVARARPAGLPRLDDLQVSPAMFGVATALTLASGLAFGLAPALAAPTSQPVLGLGGRGGSTDRRFSRLRSLLVVAEVALAMVLLMAAGLLAQSYLSLLAVDTGYDPDRVLVMPIALDSGTYTTGSKTRAFYRALIEKLEALPGVESVGGVTALPASPIGPDFDRPVWREGDAPPPGGARRADVRMATPGYFRTLGMSLLRGRGIDERDTPDATPVVVVNEALARELWGGEDPVGKGLMIDYAQAGTYPYEVVGVVADVRFYGARSQPRPELYLPHAQRSYLILNLALRSSVPPERLAPAARAALFELDPEQPAHSVVPLRELLAAEVARDRLAALVLGVFAAAAWLLTLLGIFGVVSHHVTLRRREVGVRTALGATPAAIRSLIVRQSAAVTLAGIAIGIVLSALVARLLSGLLFGIEPLDAPTLVAAGLALMLGSWIASYVPALEAGRVDPVAALRLE